MAVGNTRSGPAGVTTRANPSVTTASDVLDRRRDGFTLIELLVVIAIIALLIAMLLPTIKRAREMARRVACRSNLHQLGIGLQLYAGDHDEALPRYPGGAGAPDAITGIFQAIAPDYGMTRAVFYCPSRTDVDKGIELDTGHDLWEDWVNVVPNAPDPYHYGGEAYPTYMNLMNVAWGRDSEKPPDAHHIIETLPPGEDKMGGDLVLFADCTVWKQGLGQWVVNHTKNLGGEGGRYVPLEPDGANLLRPEGHVQWRSWEQATYKYRVPWNPETEIWW